MSERHQRNSDAMKALHTGTPFALMMIRDRGQWTTVKVTPMPSEWPEWYPLSGREVVALAGRPKRLRIGALMVKDSGPNQRVVFGSFNCFVKPKQIIGLVAENYDAKGL